MKQNNAQILLIIALFVIIGFLYFKEEKQIQEFERFKTNQKTRRDSLILAFKKEHENNISFQDSIDKLRKQDLQRFDSLKNVFKKVEKDEKRLHKKIADLDAVIGELPEF